MVHKFITQMENTGRISWLVFDLTDWGGSVEAPLTHGCCQGLGQGDHKGSHLCCLLGHHTDLVPVGAPSQCLDDSSHDWLQELRLDLFSIYCKDQLSTLTSIGLSDFSLAVCPPAMARNNLRPINATFLHENGSSPYNKLDGQHWIRSEDWYITHIKINSLDSVSLTRASFSRDGSNEQRNKLECEVNDCGHEASVLLGGGSKLQIINLVNTVSNIFRHWSKLSGKFISGIS